MLHRPIARIIFQHDAWGCIRDCSSHASRKTYFHISYYDERKLRAFFYVFLYVYMHQYFVHVSYPYGRTAGTRCVPTCTVFIKFKFTLSPNVQWVSQQTWRESEMKYYSKKNHPKLHRIKEQELEPVICTEATFENCHLYSWAYFSC